MASAKGQLIHLHRRKQGKEQKRRILLSIDYIISNKCTSSLYSRFGKLMLYLNSGVGKLLSTPAHQLGKVLPSLGVHLLCSPRQDTSALNRTRSPARNFFPLPLSCNSEQLSTDRLLSEVMPIVSFPLEGPGWLEGRMSCSFH